MKPETADKFDRIIGDLLFLDNDYTRLLETVNNYYDILCEASGTSEDWPDDIDQAEIYLETGKAISPRDAAACVRDLARTTKFIRGIFAAVLQAKVDFPGEKLEILYAGCGPFAALVLPICAKFGPSEINISLIDIHRRSLESAKKVSNSFGFSDHIGEFICGDAATYRDINGKSFHIIISETMQMALEKEPQVAITLNLAKQLRKKGVFIPQKISVSVCLANLKNEFSMELQRQRIPLGEIYEVSAESLEIEKPKTIEIPDVNTDEMWVLLLTNLVIFGDYVLGDYASGLTYPLILHDLSPIIARQKIVFRYVIGKTPRFEYQLV